MGQNGRRIKVREGEPLPRSLTRQYQGKYIVYSHEMQEVIGVGDTEDEAFAQAKASGVGGAWHSAYSDRDDDLYV
jgi:hypothetical protein